MIDLKAKGKGLWCTIWDDVRTYLTSTIKDFNLSMSIVHFNYKIENNDSS